MDNGNLIEIREDARRTNGGHPLETRKTVRLPAKWLGGRDGLFAVQRTKTTGDEINTVTGINET
ncbi:hypothetical protein [Paenibacillus ehimensis]|uniref:hypothetical protein n=1 Tax=Paenibacillus ehimensis TaxID=79264 RepID=UPI000FD8B3FF|nr:hypothetical protein [Paenibacillus ehimensis]MEC0211964.1 hypothetical protein [Paenibacillus ehimensis]